MDATQISDLAALGAKLTEMTPALAAAAAALDRDAVFPVAAIAELARAGLLIATLPRDLGGFGLCTGEAAGDLFDLFHRLGQANPSLGRIFEAHVNALDLIGRYGTGGQLETAARHAHAGALYALWVTDAPGGGACLVEQDDGWGVTGGKWFCSAAGYAHHALITAATPTGTRMLVIPTAPPLVVTAQTVGLAGMRAATTGRVDLAGVSVGLDALIGAVGDYLREPVFSAAAWRNYAVILGAVASLIGHCRSELRARGRADNPFQRMRFGEAVIAHETGRLWLREAALRAEAATGSGADAVAYVNLARIAAETACLEAIRLVQRSLGIAAFIAGGPAERIARDLAAYLRQPAPDEALDKAADYWLGHSPDWLHP